jgi:hypothetical protein
MIWSPPIRVDLLDALDIDNRRPVDAYEAAGNRLQAVQSLAIYFGRKRRGSGQADAIL